MLLKWALLQKMSYLKKLSIPMNEGFNYPSEEGGPWLENPICCRFK